MQDIKVIPLGGLGEVGKNMTVIEYGQDIFIVDAGSMFPEEDMHGIDLIIPDVSYLKDKIQRIRGVFITHGHEDHIGSLPYILPMIQYPPVYATRLTAGLIMGKLKEHALQNKVQIHQITASDSVRLGSCTFEFFSVNHSIPDAVGILIRTPLGNIVHTGDYKFDFTPVDGRKADIGTIAKIGNEGVLLLLAESTRIESSGFTPSEQVLEDSFDKIFANASRRILIASFASNISRVQQIINTAVRYDRHVALVGRSMINNVQIATELQYLKVPKHTLIRIEEAHKFRPEQIVIICTGSQGEPTSALTRIANGAHKTVSIQAGDTVVISGTPVPGNEKMVNRTLNNLFRLEAEVFYQGIALVHVSGHAAKEEMKLMLNLIRPKFFIPIHGEYRQLVLHQKLARSLGIYPQNTIVIEDGDVVSVTKETIEKSGHTPCRYVFIDGATIGEVGQSVIEERQNLAQDGIFIVNIILDKKTGRVIAEPTILSRGFAQQDKTQQMNTQILAQIVNTIQTRQSGQSISTTKERIIHSIESFFTDTLHRHPMIFPIITEV